MEEATAPASDRATSETVSLIANLITPAAVAKLLAEHVDDGHGYCRACKFTQQGYYPWPCIFHAAATLAAERHHGQPL
jgi:hypothetical protein